MTSNVSTVSSASTVIVPPPPVSLGTSLLLAGLSNCTAAFCTNPIDVLKVRLQIAHTGVRSLHHESLGQTIVKIIRNEGYLAFYQGLVPSLLRESTYSAIRLGLYEPYKNYITHHIFSNSSSDSFTTSSTRVSTNTSTSSSAPVPYSIRFLAGACSGMTGAILTNPIDILKVRLQARSSGTDISSTTVVRRTVWTMVRNEFRTMHNEFHHILNQEGQGIRGLWQGSTPNLTRAALLTASQLGSYDTSKSLFQHYLGFHEGMGLHFSASMIAGIAAAVITSPVDTVKTRLMIQASLAAGTSSIRSNGMIDSFRKIVKYEGFRGLYKGFHTQWIRIGPHTTITLLVYEQLRKYVGMKPV